MGQRHNSVITGRVGPSSAPGISQTVLTSAPSACAAAPVAIPSEISVRTDDQVLPTYQCDSAEQTELPQERASSLRECDRRDAQPLEAAVHAASKSLTWTGRGAGLRPLYLAACFGQGCARPLSGDPPTCLPCTEANTLPPIGRIVHARAFGQWRPAMVVLCGPDPRTVLVRWWHDSRLCVLAVSDLVVTPESLQYEEQVDPDSAAGPPVTLGQAAYARFYGEWHPGIIRSILPDALGVQILWTADFTTSNVPFVDVRTVPAWMLDSAALEQPELRKWLVELAGRVVTPEISQYEEKVDPASAARPPVTLGQTAYARFYGEWHPGIIRRILPDARGVQILWTADCTKSNVPFIDVRTVPAWMLDPAVLEQPELRGWLAEITGREE